MAPILHVCPYCYKRFTSEANLNRHQGAKESPCYDGRQRAIQQKLSAIPIYDPHDPEDIPCDDEPNGGYDPQGHNEDNETDVSDPIRSEVPERDPTPPSLPPLSSNTPPKILQVAEESQPIASGITQSQRRVIPHVNRPRTYGGVLTTFEVRRAEEKKNGLSPYRGFREAKIFEFAEWIMSNRISQRAESDLLHTRLVSQSMPV